MTQHKTIEGIVREFDERFFHATIRQNGKDYIEFSTVAVPYEQVTSFLRTELSALLQELVEEVALESVDLCENSQAFREKAISLIKSRITSKE